MLEPFGFTRTQAAVFIALQKRGTATGYALAKEAGLARANTYDALDALVARGVVEASGKHPVHYRPVDSGRLLQMLRAEADDRLASLASRLRVTDATADAGDVAVLTGADEIEREAVVAVDGSTEEVLAVVGPWAPRLAEALDRARGRGVSTRGVALGGTPPGGAVLREVPRSELEKYWGGLPVAVVADRCEAVAGTVLGGEGRGVASRNPGLVPFLRHLLRRELQGAHSARRGPDRGQGGSP